MTPTTPTAPPARKILTVAGEGGSSGKTSTSVTLASLLARQGRNVLVGDLDLQANATTWFGVDPGEVEHTIGEVLLREVSLPEALVETNTPGVRLLPASRDLGGDTLQLQRVTGPEQRLKVAFRDLPEDVDTVILDCPGNMSVLTIAALMVATGVLTTAIPAPKEIQGAAAFAETVIETADVYGLDGLELDAVVPCQVPPVGNGTMYQDGVRKLGEVFPDAVTHGVRRTVRVPESASHRTPLPQWAPSHAATDDYRQVLADLATRELL